MPQSLANVMVHLVFSTKGRNPLIVKSVQPGLHGYLAETSRELGCECFRAGGTGDHVHLAIRLARTITIAKLIETTKSSSSRWIKTQPGVSRDFAWQVGYGAFSFRPSELDTVIRYIDHQEEHHRSLTFQDEYLELLREHGLAWDDRYVWD